MMSAYEMLNSFGQGLKFYIAHNATHQIVSGDS